MDSEGQRFRTDLTLIEMEALISRVVREAVHEEFARVLRHSPATITSDWTHEGPEDSAGDHALLAEALAMSERYRTSSEPWMDWETFKAELKAAEAAGELPD